MNTVHFKYAIEIEKTGSITKAAQNLYMAQPNLSKSMKDLEENLGYSIFQRSSQGMVPTKKGTLFLQYAKKIMEQLEELELQTQNPGSEVQSFKISMPRGSYIANGFTEFIAELEIDKGIDITAKETNSLQTIADVAEDGHNLGIIRYQMMYENYFLDYLKRKGLIYDTIWEFEYLILMSDRHPLAVQDTISGSDLLRYIEIAHCDTEIPFISDTEDIGLEREHPDKKIYVYERGSQFDLLTHVPTTFMWVSPLPERYLRQYGLVQKACKVENNQYKDILIYRKGYRFSPMDIKFQKKLYESRVEVSSRLYV